MKRKAKPTKEKVVAFKVEPALAELLDKLPNKSAFIRKAIAANPKAVADFKKGKTKAADAIKGAVMRETKGLAKTELVQHLLLQELEQVC